MLAFGLFVFLGLLGLDDFKALLLLPLGILRKFSRELSGIGPDLFFLFGLIVCAKVVEVVDEEVDELDFVKVLLELVLFFAFFVALLVFCLARLSLLVGDFLVLDAGLPLDVVDQLLLLPVILLLLVVLVPNFIAIGPDASDLLFQFLQTHLLAFFPGLVLLIESFLFLGFLCLFCCDLLHGG